MVRDAGVGRGRLSAQRHRGSEAAWSGKGTAWAAWGRQSDDRCPALQWPAADVAAMCRATAKRTPPRWPRTRATTSIGTKWQREHSQLSRSRTTGQRSHLSGWRALLATRLRTCHSGPATLIGPGLWSLRQRTHGRPIQFAAPAQQIDRKMPSRVCVCICMPASSCTKYSVIQLCSWT